MYEADGIDLSKSEHDALMELVNLGGEADDELLRYLRKSLSNQGPYSNLASHGLVRISHDDEWNLVGVSLSQPKASDWISAYDAAQAEKKRLSRREVKLAVWNTLGGAIAGGLVAWALYALFGIT